MNFCFYLCPRFSPSSCISCRTCLSQLYKWCIVPLSIWNSPGNLKIYVHLPAALVFGFLSILNTSHWEIQCFLRDSPAKHLGFPQDISPRFSHNDIHLPEGLRPSCWKFTKPQTYGDRLPMYMVKSIETWGIFSYEECAENLSFRVDKAWRQRCSQRFRNVLAAGPERRGQRLLGHLGVLKNKHSMMAQDGYKIPSGNLT